MMGGHGMMHHLAILYPVYVDEIIVGHKTVECRLGHEGYPPHGAVQAGDLLWLKDVSGPVRAVVSVREVQTIRLRDPDAVERIRQKWNGRILAPPEFWDTHRNAQVATLIVLGDLCAFKPFRVIKTDRRAWVSMSRPPVPGKPVR
jgi:hypothetical protein